MRPAHRNTMPKGGRISMHAHLVQVVHSIFHLLLHLLLQLAELCDKLGRACDTLFRTSLALRGVLHRRGPLPLEGLCAHLLLPLERVQIRVTTAQLLQTVALGLRERLQAGDLAVEGLCINVSCKSDDCPPVTYTWATGLRDFTFLLLGLLLRHLDKVLAPLDLHMPAIDALSCRAR